MDPVMMLQKTHEMIVNMKTATDEHVEIMRRIFETPANELSTADFLALADGFDKMAHILREASKTIRVGVEPQPLELN